jgi:DNA polymerase I
VSLFGGVEITGRPNLENARRIDLLVIPQLRRMTRAGFCIDPPYLRDLGSQFGADMQRLEKEIASYIPTEALHRFCGEAARAEGEAEEAGGDSGEFNAASAEQIGELLFALLDLGGTKKLKRTAGGKVSTGKKNLELMRGEHPVVAAVLQYREVAKLKSTYCQTLVDQAKFHPRGPCCPVCEWAHETDQWRVHGQIGTTRAATWRMNHKAPNLANLPVRTENGQMILAGFIAPPGKVIVARDLKQIELCALAHLANAKTTMIPVYQAGGDIHDNTARKVFGLGPDEKPDKIKHRLPSKRWNFSIMNGTTDRGLYMQLVMDYGQSGYEVPDWLSVEWCEQSRLDWLKEYWECDEYFSLNHYRARRYGLVWNMFGFCRLVPEVRSYHAWIREAGLRQAQNLPITSSAAGLLKLGMADLESRLTERWTAEQVVPLVPVHDSVMVEADADKAEEVDREMAEAMEGVMTDRETGEYRFRVPIKSDGKVMTRWIP